MVLSTWNESCFSVRISSSSNEPSKRTIDLDSKVVRYSEAGFSINGVLGAKPEAEYLSTCEKCPRTTDSLGPNCASGQTLTGHIFFMLSDF
ncbi:MAG: hypothetical protein ACD_47C00059G0001 [uncultured bacterium]|nr:MAG: hypothetical protein ACD_47C00059G0001 [uncultured bacterium]